MLPIRREKVRDGMIGEVLQKIGVGKMSINSEWKDEIFQYLDQLHQKFTESDPGEYASSVIDDLHKKYKLSVMEAADWIKAWSEEYIQKNYNENEGENNE